MRRLFPAFVFAVVAGLGATSLRAEAQATDLPMNATPAPAPTPVGQRPLPMGASHADDRHVSSLPTCPASDPMVWLDTRHRLYYAARGEHPKRTPHGHFACTSGAIAVGAAPAANAGK